MKHFHLKFPCLLAKEDGGFFDRFGHCYSLLVQLFYHKSHFDVTSQKERKSNLSVVVWISRNYCVHIIVGNDAINNTEGKHL